MRTLLFLTFLGLMFRLPVSAQLLEEPRFNVEEELTHCSVEEWAVVEDCLAQMRYSGGSLLTRVLMIAESQENPRVVAAILAVTLGPFGVHRLYLGTDARVPIFYTLTLGGGLGILPVVDLLHILLTRDLSRYYNHPGVFIWGERPASEKGE